MAAFVYYNPKTNTIERKFPTQPMSFQMPYLLNIQPQDINLAMRNTVDVRANPVNFQQPSESFLPQFPPQEKVENFRLTKKVEKEMPKKSSLPPQRDHEENTNPAPPSNNFLMMEDLREEDLNSIPDYYQAPAVEQPKARSSFKAQSFEPERALKKKPTFPDVQQNYAQEEARGDFKLVRHEDLMLKYKPEDYSINERILNAKYIREEQEKTKKFMLERMGNDLKTMEKAATMWEKDMEQTGKDTQDLEEKTKKIWEEVERKKFELKAQEIMNNVDRAVEIGHDLEQEDRIEQLLKENRALYAEIDKVLEDEGNPYEDGPTQYSLYTSPDTHKSSSSKTKGASVRRPGSSSQTRPAFDTSKSIVEQKFGRKNIVKTVSENKIKGATRVQMGSPGKKKTTAGKNSNTMFKNPKKVEEALQKARKIADLY